MWIIVASIASIIFFCLIKSENNTKKNIAMISGMGAGLSFLYFLYFFFLGYILT